jgi:hypothetical protein
VSLGGVLFGTEAVPGGGLAIHEIRHYWICIEFLKELNICSAPWTLLLLVPANRPTCVILRPGNASEMSHGAF